MLARPKLVKNNPNQNKAINLKGEAKGSARFLLGLSNRVNHMDKRVTRLESTADHILRHHIGYKELGLTFVLALLMFTSITLGLKEFSSHDKPYTLVNQQALLAPLLQQNNQLQAELKETQSTPQYNQNITYQWPLEKQIDSQNIEYAHHKHGIELPAKLGDPIVAVDSGKVIYSGNAINSFGNLILVQHKHDVISVYGNNYSNYVAEGDSVKKGQLIAAVGEGSGKQSGLYFEVRFKGKAQDPFLYFQ